MCLNRFFLMPPLKMYIYLPVLWEDSFVIDIYMLMYMNVVCK